jgi:alpha,alpha-trehalase
MTSNIGYGVSERGIGCFTLLQYFTSQPPLLSMMILAIFKREQDPSLLKTALPVLLQEHKFWTTDPHIVLLEDSGCNVHQLSRYWARWDSPRPESSTTDTNVTAGLSTSRQKQLYHDIATAAESGWDFSSRWMQDQEHLTTLRTSSIIPVDLNSFLFQMEVNIAFFAKVVGDIETSRNFSVFAKSRKKAIQSILWNAKMGQWFDYWLPACSKKVTTINNCSSRLTYYLDQESQFWLDSIIWTIV